MTSNPAAPADQTDPIPQDDPLPIGEDPDGPRDQPAAGTIIHLVAGGDSCRPGELCD
ncbi:hypothetical protein ACN261_29530 [Micromonospora sp. WMMD723]|uniref:hypothetical protein n=1 Tax=Micromonospora TaxID=1873 RepID=UPI0013042154|nr:hypothetical protein [Micromonospora wenchangensis]